MAAASSRRFCTSDSWCTRLTHLMDSLRAAVHGEKTGEGGEAEVAICGAESGRGGLQANLGVTVLQQVEDGRQVPPIEDVGRGV